MGLVAAVAAEASDKAKQGTDTAAVTADQTKLSADQASVAADAVTITGDDAAILASLQPPNPPVQFLPANADGSLSIYVLSADGLSYTLVTGQPAT